MRIALVGNGPVSAVDAREIDGHDLVFRFNTAKTCGLHGRRTDVLAVLDIRRIGDRKFSPLALAGAREFWLGEAKVEAPPTRAEAAIGSRPRKALTLSPAIEHLRPHAPAPGTVPSCGAMVLGMLLDEPDAVMSLFGFTHRGNAYHDWKAESAWCDALARRGVVRRYASEDGPADVISLRVRRQILRLRTHVATLRF